MPDIKLIASDLDGTFLSSDHHPHPDNIKAVRECQKRGIRVCACTGRLWSDTRRIVEMGGFDRYCVTNNGASIVDYKTGEIRFRSRIDPEYLEQILRVGVEADGGVTVSGHETVYAYRPTTPDIKWRIERAKKMPEEYRTKILLFDDLNEMVDASAPDAEKVSLRMNFMENVDDIYEELSKVTDVEITSSWVGNIEITSIGGTKAQAISVLADIYGATWDQVMTLGDNYNDISMLMWAGIGVAMDNADQRLKNIADYVTARNYEGGVAKAIHKFALK